MATADEALAMRRAITLAARGLGSTSANPVVGCVVLDAGGQVVGERCTSAAMPVRCRYLSPLGANGPGWRPRRRAPLRSAGCRGVPGAGVPWPDAYFVVGMLAVMAAQARGRVEFWFARLAVDLVGVPLAFSSGLAFSGLVYGIYPVQVIFAVRAWWLRARAPRARPDTWKERQHDLVRD